MCGAGVSAYGLNIRIWSRGSKEVEPTAALGLCQIYIAQEERLLRAKAGWEAVMLKNLGFKGGSLLLRPANMIKCDAAGLRLPKWPVVACIWLRRRL